VRDGAALRGMLAFRFNGNRVLAENVQLAFGEGLLIKLAALGRGGDWIEHAGIAMRVFRVIRDELIAVGSDPIPGSEVAVSSDASPRSLVSPVWKRVLRKLRTSILALYGRF
jgi:hypothetical protein